MKNGNGAKHDYASEYRGLVKASTIATRTDTLETHVALVQPADAEKWLTHNSHNRAIRNTAVQTIVGVIERGEWVMNGDAIRFGIDGVLQDGQHRLWGIVLSEIAVPSLVMTGLPPEAQETMDVGARRSLADALRLRGEPNGASLAATLNYWWRYQNGHIRYASVKPSIPQAIALLEAHPGLREAMLDANKGFAQRFRGSNAMMASALYEFRSIDSEDADLFYDKLVSGTELKMHDPILLLRKHFEGNNLASSANAMRASALVDHALTNKAWNYWRDGREIERLNWKAAGVKAEPFPSPH